MYRFLVLGLLTAGATLQATSFGFQTTGTDNNGNPVGASVIFKILDAHDFTATISDTTSSILDLQQLIEGLKFSFSGAGLLLVGSNGERIMIGPNGAMRVLGAGATDWGAGLSGSDSVLCAICGDGQGADIAGADPSLAGTFLSGNVSFTFTTASSLPTDGADPFSNVSFLFLSGGNLVVIPAAAEPNRRPAVAQSVGGNQGTGAGGPPLAGSAAGGQYLEGTGGVSGTAGFGGAGESAGSNDFPIPTSGYPDTPGSSGFGGAPGVNGSPHVDPSGNVSRAGDPPLALPEPATLPIAGLALLAFAFCRKRSAGL